jgi:hypothetical protein
MDYNLVSLIIATASLAVAGAATVIAKSSLSQAKRVAERDLRDWKQRTWADVYFKGDEAYDALDALQKQYGDSPMPLETYAESLGFTVDRNDVMNLLRRVN